MRNQVTPDGRYFVVRGRPWRCSNPALSADRRSELTRELMDARSDKRRTLRAGDLKGRKEARQRVEAAKQSLGERGAIWWTDGAPDWNRHMAAIRPMRTGSPGCPRKGRREGLLYACGRCCARSQLS
jgi:hypothetical protein